MVARKLSKEKYIIAAFITFGIFFLGMLLGMVIEEKRIGYIEALSQQQRLEFNSIQLQYLYIDQLSQEENCVGISETFEENLNSLESARIRIENYNKNARASKEEFDFLKRDYTIVQLRYWLLAKRTKQACNLEIVSILYFYAEDCPSCDEQAFILTYLKKRFKEKLLVFALYSSFEQEPMIKILKKTFNITINPTLIIEDKKFEGLISRETILKEICSHYTTEIEDCEAYR